jgi:hypothetical protein
MKKKIKKTLIILGSTLLFFLLLVAIASFLFFYRKPFVKGIVEKKIEKRTGIHVIIGALDYDLFPLRIEAAAIEFSVLMDKTEVDVFIKRLVLNGDIHRIRKKKKPYFDTIEAEGVRIISNIKEARKKIMIEDILRSLSSGMEYVRKVSLQNSSLEFNFPEQKLILQGLDFTLSPSRSQDSFAYTLFCQRVEGIGQPKTNRFQNTIQGSGTVSIEEKPTLMGRFIFTSNHLVYEGKEEYFEEIDLNFGGKFLPDKNEFIFPIFEFEIPFFVSITGSLEISSQDELILLFRSKLQIDNLSRILALAKEQLPQQFDGLELGGSAHFEGEAQITPTRPDRKTEISGKVLLNPIWIKYRTPEYQFDSDISGNFEIDRFPDNQNIRGRLKITKSAFSGKGLNASGIKMDAPFVYDDKGSRIDFPSLKASASSLSWVISNRKFKTESPSILGRGFIDLGKKRFHISKTIIEIHPFPPIEVEAQAIIGPQASSSFSLSMQSSRIGFKTLMDYFSFAIPQKVNDWEPDGWMNIQIKAQASIREKRKVWEVSARLSAFDVQFHDPSFTLAGESLQPSLTLKCASDHILDDFEFSAELELTQGESLWKDFYVKWTEMPFLGTIGGRFHVPQKKLADLSIGAAIPDFGRITAKGHLDLQKSPSADLRVMASSIQLAPLYAFLSQKQSISKTLVKLEGEAESQVDAKIEKNAFSVVGHLKVKDASWTDEGGNLNVQGIDAHIPLHYEQNTLKTKDEKVSTEKGHLTFQKIRFPYLELALLRLDISSQENGYSVQPFELDIFGQKAYVGETSFEYAPNILNFKALTSFSWKDVDLSKLPFLSQDFQLEGNLSVDLPIVEISPNRVDTEGQGRVNTFGGDIAIENIQIYQPFSKNRTISCDLRLFGLDLEKITDTIPFGRVTGIINGEIQDFAFSYGQPERFDIRIESEKKKGVPQRFSLKATNDLAILGTGEKTPFSAQSGWTRFVKEFRYSKIGIACSLKNDIFSLRGTIQGKGVEYLVKGSGLFAINVVNKQTRNQIQFKDMLNRLKRIGQSKQTP